MSDPQLLVLVHREMLRTLEQERERRALRAGLAGTRPPRAARSSLVGRFIGRSAAPQAACCRPA